MAKAFVTGGSGLLGTALCYVLLQRSFDVSYGYRTNRIPLDDNRLHPVQIEITRQTSLRVVAEIKPDLIIHAASFKNVDGCEENPSLASLVNVGGTRNICETAKTTRCKLAFVSSNDVFGGERGFYSEDEDVDPPNVYARTKVEAEKVVLASDKEALVVRTSMHGWHWNQENSLSMRIIRSLQRGEKLSMATDQFSSLLLNLDLAEYIVRLLEREARGVIHVASSNALSRYDFALVLAKEFGLDPSLIAPDLYANIWKRLNLKARRPPNATLNANKAKGILGELPTVESGVVRMRTSAREYARRMGFEEAVRI